MSTSNLRKKTRIETQYMVSARLGSEGHTEKEIRAMILNISMDGALIETAEPVSNRSVVLVNTYKNQTVTIHAKIIHHQNVPHEERVFGPYRTGLHFLNNTLGAREFIVSIIKSQEVDEPRHQTKEKSLENEDMPSGWMDTEQITLALFSTDTFGEELEMTSPLEDISDIVSDDGPKEEPATAPVITGPKDEPQIPAIITEPKQTETAPDETVKTVQEKPPLFKDVVEQTLFEPGENAGPALPPVRIASILLTILAFVVLAGSLVVFRTPVHDGAASFTEKLGIDIPFVGERPILPPVDMPEPLSGDLAPPARLLNQTIQSTMVNNDRLGPLFVIRGSIKLEPGHRPEEVNVRGKLLDPQKKMIASMTVWPGNKIDDAAVTGFDSNDLEMVRNYTPETGYRSQTPFTMIFSEIPNNTHSFVVDLTFNTF